MGKYYVVWSGRDTGVFDNWDDARELVENFPGARYKSFKTMAQAVAAFRGDGANDMAGLARMFESEQKVINFTDFPDIDLNAIAVDASCMGNPGIMEYRGVDVETGAEIFRVGPFANGTNNIGEYLALVHALAFCAQRRDSRTIYTDSVTALSWLRRRKANTRLTPTAENARLMQLIARADAWVQSHSWPNEVRKWDTEKWGEIPADFGRK